MKPLVKAFLLFILFTPLALQPALASEGGGGGDGGGKSERVKNPEEKSAPSGFVAHKRTYGVKAATMTPAHIQNLIARGYISESDQRDRGDRDWKDKASQASQAQWEKYQAAAYDVTSKQAGMSMVDASAMASQPTFSTISPALAFTAWSMVTRQGAAAGDDNPSRLGKAVNVSTSARKANALDNLAP